MEKCYLCPRGCGVDRQVNTGACHTGDKIKIAKYMVHMWEEPPISGTKGSGCIFFSGCPLGCVYCQNKEISRGTKGEEISTPRLAEIMLELQNLGVHNINLVTPTHFSSQIRDAIDLVRDKLKVPVVYNTSGYEKPEEIEKMTGYVDVFLTDIKYFSPEASRKYSHAEDYFQVTIRALEKMLELAPQVRLDEEGIIKSGVIVRHLVLPTLRHDSMKILDKLKADFSIDSFKLSLMSQYTPEFCDPKYPELCRRLTGFEYQSVLKHAIELGFDGYLQEASSATSKYTPKF
ncbi:MAG: radical SAM protein [Clostridia bacterium]|nr:radical SAM protein [Clostridia bacterium]